MRISFSHLICLSMGINNKKNQGSEFSRKGVVVPMSELPINEPSLRFNGHLFSVHSCTGALQNTVWHVGCR